MPVELVFASNPIRRRDPRLALQFEQAVTDALRAHEDAAAPGPVHVRFSVWDGEDVPRYVCKVECASRRPMERAAPAWRWWSALVETPHELGRQLREAARAHRSALCAPGARVAETEETWERWGLGGRDHGPLSATQLPAAMTAIL